MIALHLTLFRCAQGASRTVCSPEHNFQHKKVPIWVIRDQKITPSQAHEISRLYFAHIYNIKKKFDIWHLTWAISDIYRLGDDSVKVALQDAYQDATKRASEQKGIADRMANGNKLYMGDAHSGGRAFAKKHVVVPGKKGYLQSYDEYIRKNSLPP
jgi:hypothetical protein